MFIQLTGILSQRIVGSAPTYLLRDEFTTPEASPLTSPRTCEPGPGTLTVTDTGNNLDISSGSLVISGTTGSKGNPGLYGTELTRFPGLSLFHKFSRDGNNIAIGFGKTNTGRAEASSIYYYSAGLRAFDDRVSVDIGSIGTDVYQAAIILRSSGAFFVIDINGAGYKLYWVGTNDSDSSIYAGITAGIGATSNVDTVDNFTVDQLPAPWNSDDGIATDAIASPAVGNTFAHEADGILEFTIDTLPSASFMDVHIRGDDTSNYWQIFIEYTGKLALREFVSGSPTTRATTSVGALSGGERLVVVFDDETITVYYDNTQAWSYSSAANFKTATAGEVNSLGTGGAISNLVTWPRTLSGDALTTLEAYTE